MKNEQPFPHSFFEKIARDTFSPIVRGESTFIRWFPGHGKTIALQHILSDRKLLQAGLGQFYTRYVLVYVDTSIVDMRRPEEFFYFLKELLTKELIQQKILPSKNKNPAYVSSLPPLVVTLKSIFEQCQLVVEKGREVIFLIDITSQISGETHRELFKALEQIVETNRTRIHINLNSFDKDLLLSGQIPPTLIQNVITVPLPSKRECDFYTQHYVSKWNIRVPSSRIQEIYAVCGHDPWLVKEALRIYKRNGANEVNLLQDPILLLKAKLEYEQYSKAERDAIGERIKRNHLPQQFKQIARELVTMGFWDEHYHLPKIITQVVLHTAQISELIFDTKTKTLHLGDVDVSRKLSPVEHQVLCILFQRINKPTLQGQLVTRDEVAGIIWGDKMLDSFSDWAIDKAISRLRQKLGALTSAYTILTKKKEGFHLVL